MNELPGLSVQRVAHHLLGDAHNHYEHLCWRRDTSNHVLIGTYLMTTRDLQIRDIICWLDCIGDPCTCRHVLEVPPST